MKKLKAKRFIINGKAESQKRKEKKVILVVQ